MTFQTGYLDSEEWAEKIKSLRQEKGWSQKKLADQLDIHPQSISEIERGNERFTLERLNRLLDALGYKGEITINRQTRATRSQWGPIHARSPEQRRLIRNAREFSETLANALYRKYGVDKIYCVGSLVKKQGTEFTEQSDIDLLVEGLDPADRIPAESKLEIDYLEPPPEGKDFSFDLLRVEDNTDSPQEQIKAQEAVFIPLREEDQ